MSVAIPKWLRQGAGEAPASVQIFRAEATITAFASMLECGDFVGADTLGTLYRLDPYLKVALLTRLQEPVRRIAWADTGQIGVAAAGKNLLLGIDARLKVLWTIELPFECTALAIDPFGQYVFAAASQTGGLLLDAEGKRVGSVASPRPIAFAAFLLDQPILIAAAEHGFLAAFSVRGKTIWERSVWSAVSDLTIVDKRALICLATLNHGIQVFTPQGENASSLVLEGTVHRISSSYSGRQILAGTVEQHLYRLNEDGEMLWATQADTPIAAVHSHPLGNSGLIVMDSDTAYRLEW